MRKESASAAPSRPCQAFVAGVAQAPPGHPARWMERRRWAEPRGAGDPRALHPTARTRRRRRGDGSPRSSAASLAGEELVAEELRGGRAVAGLALHAGADEVVAVGGQPLGDGGGGVREADVLQGEHHVVEGLRAPRLLRRRHLDDRAPQAPDVRLPPEAVLLLDHLRGHPGYGAHGREGLRVHGALGAAKVCKLQVKLEPDEDVGCLDVAVHYGRAPRVQVAQALSQPARALLQEGAIN
mmetsp:Transcript_56295/g.164534  ORF Transcript_56295/g.164534 Transcript_56295/m.164534 type:complete len:240 (-) Transcript_56295:1154-1873(-)